MNTRNALVIVLAICAGVVLGIAWEGGEIFPFPRPSRIRDVPHPSRTYEADGIITTRASADLHIPVRYLPKRRVVTDGQGTKHIVQEEGKAVLDVPSEEVALILVDTWSEPNEADDPSPVRLNQKSFLEECRRNGVTIIHAPNHPIVDKYPQYPRLRDEVRNFLSQFDHRAAPLPPFLNWPLPNNRLWLQTTKMRLKGRAPGDDPRPAQDRDISRLLTPLPNEYVLSSYTEFRYVLWKERINLLLYMGGALNECMQHRDTGINILAGIDSKRVPVTIVVLEDCSSALASPDVDAQTAARVMLEYFEFKIAFVAKAKDLRFTLHAQGASEVERSGRGEP